MAQETVVRFFTKLMRNANLHVHRFSPECPIEYDMGLRKALGLELPDLLPQMEHIRDNTVYMVEDNFCWRYLALRLPQCAQMLIVGPYLSEEIGDHAIMSIMEEIGLAPGLFPVLRRFYHSMPTLLQENMLFIVVSTLGEMLWGAADAFSTVVISRQESHEFFDSNSALPHFAAEKPDMELIEQRYECEAELLYAISHGQIHKANAILTAFSPGQVDQRTANPLRNTKNYAIISNTLMRKAAQQGGVHPYYIDQLSTAIAKRIEQTLTVEETQQLLFSMAHKYCLLVKNHSMKDYSLPVQRVILRTDAEIAGDLSLGAHARHIGVNASYLSSLFKKETGMTLTEYVNARRVDYAIFLLNSTSMQIQTIAQHCGLTDVNYFTRTFRRLTGKTPTQYRQSVQFSAP